VSTSRWAAETSEYHYGMASRLALALRMVASHRVALDMSARMVSLGRITHRAEGHDDISRVDTALTWRLQGQHAVGVNYVWSHRAAEFPATGARNQTLGTIGVFYTLLGDGGFGTVDWRAPKAE
jgi:hypothetical protein